MYIRDFNNLVILTMYICNNFCFEKKKATMKYTQLFERYSVTAQTSFIL